MNIYLFSPFTASLESGENFYYLTKDNPIILNEVNENQIINITPKSDFEDCKFITSTPIFCKNMLKIDLYDGFLIIPKLILKRNKPRKTIFFKTQNYYGRPFNIMVVTDGGIKLIISGEGYHDEIELFFEPTVINVFPCDNAPIILISLEREKKHLVAVSLPEIKILFNQVCDEFKLENNLTTTIFHQDIARHREDNLWDAKNSFKLIGRSLKTTKNVNNIDIIPYAFLQEIALCGDYSQFLTNDLQEKSSLIFEFLGNFEYVIPPIISYKENKILLVNKNKITFVSFSFDYNKISDVTVDD